MLDMLTLGEVEDTMRRLSKAIVIFVIVGLMAAAGAALSVLPAIQNPSVENKQIKDTTLNNIGSADDRLSRVIGRNESSINRAVSSTNRVISSTGTVTSTRTVTNTVTAASTVTATPRPEQTVVPLVPGGEGTEFALRINNSIQEKVDQGRQVFRFDTFGDEDFWGGTLRLHQAIKGEKLGGVGAGVSPKTALDVGLKVDADALPAPLIQDLKAGKVDLNSPATTVALLKLNAVVGVKGFFNNNSGDLESVGITCAFCHSTVDDSLAPGIGHRLDGWANHDLNVGAIVALSPNLTVFADLLGTDVATVKTVLNSWGPGKFDAELNLDGKAFNPQQVTDGVVTGTNVSGATLIPNAFGMAGFSQHTWTGAWGGIPYWNAFVANLEMHGKGTFFDPRLDNASKFPVAAKNGFGHIRTNPDDDLITSKIPALHFYQVALPAPKPKPGVDFNESAAKRGDELFSGKAQCNNCHVEPLWTEPGWDLHKPEEIGIDGFEANRAPDGVYKTMNLAGIFVRENGLFMKPENKGRFYHDGRFATLMDVVNHYNNFFKLGLTEQEKKDLVEYLKSLPEK
ncbi:MAG: hypothetical protein OIN66_12230 [Candidatus Methanoperedens sp.]|nr:hypothetical protein [Candidatus Methanoperedens sp.]